MSTHERTIPASSVLQRVPHEKLPKVDRAIVTRDPPSNRAVFQKFALAADGVSFSSFGRYAYRLRQRAESIHLAELTRPDDVAAAQLLPRLMVHRISDALTVNESSANTLSKLINGFHKLNRAEAEFSARQQQLLDNALISAHQDP